MCDVLSRIFRLFTDSKLIGNNLSARLSLVAKMYKACQKNVRASFFFGIYLQLELIANQDKRHQGDSIHG